MGEVEAKKDKVARASLGMHDRHIPVVVIDEEKEKALKTGYITLYIYQAFYGYGPRILNVGYVTN